MIRVGKKIYVSFRELIELGYDYPKEYTKVVHVDNQILTVVLGPEALEFTDYLMIKQCDGKWIDWVEVCHYKNGEVIKKPKQEMFIEISPDTFTQK